MLNKKAVAVDDVLPLLFVVVLVVVATLVVPFLMDGKKVENEKKVMLITERIEAAGHLQEYLHAQTTEGKRNADVLVEHYLAGRLDELYPSLKTFFNPLYAVPGAQSWRTWKIQVLDSSNNVIFDEKGTTGTNQGGLDTVLLSRVVLPLPDNTYLRIGLYKYGRSYAVQPTGY